MGAAMLLLRMFLGFAFATITSVLGSIEHTSDRFQEATNVVDVLMANGNDKNGAPSPELAQLGKPTPKECICTGWTPKTGKWKGTGAKCAWWGWTTQWCYVQKSYVGPGHEFVKPSLVYPGKFYAPCEAYKDSKIPKVAHQCRN